MVEIIPCKNHGSRSRVARGLGLCDLLPVRDWYEQLLTRHTMTVDVNFRRSPGAPAKKSRATSPIPDAMLRLFLSLRGK